MRYLIAIVFCLTFSGISQAQFGLNGKFLSPQNNWQVNLTNTNQERTIQLFDQGWSAGVDYWFRLKNKRIEFLPELNYAQLNNSQEDYSENKASIYSFFFNTNIYFLDFAGDCDCPTWSKEGPTLKKGLFLQLSPGISYWDASVGTGDDVFANRPVAFSIGGGLGFDLGISDLVTITPVVNARYFPEVSIENMPRDQEAGNFLTAESASPLFWSAGLRLGFRLDGARY